MAPGYTQSLIEMSTVIFLRVKGGRRVRLTTSPPSVSCLENVGASTSHNFVGTHGLLQEELHFFVFYEMQVEYKMKCYRREDIFTTLILQLLYKELFWGI
jgi:hypothetical protein